MPQCCGLAHARKLAQQSGLLYRPQTSRPLLLAAVGRTTHSGGRTELHLTPMHAEVGLIKAMIANIQQAIAYAKRSAQQLPKIDRWRVLVRYICEQITRQPILQFPKPASAGDG